MNATIYAFGDTNQDLRRYIDAEELTDLAARFEAIATSLRDFAESDDRAEGLYRPELLRLVRETADRAKAILS